jgi:outer membrane protein assembly factor BamE (lipoprotein component of BamABCDE complex)
MRLKNALLAASLGAVVAGCASMDGRDLVAGQSTAREVEARMGAPTERITVAGGDTTWYYSRQPTGLQMIAVRLTPAGVVRSVEQLLTEDNLRNLVPGSTTRAQARQIVGPPWRTSHFDRQQREVWEYRMYNAQQWEYFLNLQFSGDGIVREVLLLKDYSKEQGDGTQP